MEQTRELATYDLDWTDPGALSDEDLVQFVERQFESGKSRRGEWEQAAQKQLAWAEGSQDLDFDDFDSTVKELKRINFVERDKVPFAYQHPVEINTIRGVVLQRMAILLGGNATLYAIPATPEDEDIMAARAQTQLLQYMWHSKPTPVRRTLLHALWLMFCTGIAWLHPYWNPAAGETETFGPNFDANENEEPRDARVAAFREQVGEMLGLAASDVRLNERFEITAPPGEPDWDVRSGFDITEPEFALDLDECAWLMDTRWRSFEYLRARYGAKVYDLEPIEPDDAYLQQYRSLFRSRHLIEGQTGVPEGKPEQVMVHSLWRPRNSQTSPVGALVIVAGGKVLYKGPNPYPHGRLPYVPLRELPVKSLRPRCTVADLMTMQDERNRLRGLMNSHVHHTVAPKIMVERGVNLPDNAFDRNERLITDLEEGAVSGNKIKAFAMPSVPPDAYRLDEMYRRDMLDVAAVHDSTMGRGESGSQSGRHAAIVQQGDVRSTWVTRSLLQDAIADAAGQALWLWWRYAGTERTVTITGPDMVTEVLAFKGEQLFDRKRYGREPGPHDFNTLCVMGPDNELEQNVGVIEMMTKLGYWSPQRDSDRQRINRMIGDRAPGDLDDEERHRTEARVENKRIARGDMVYAAIGNEHDVHTHEHERWTTTGEYRDAIRKNKEVKDRVEIHVREHWLLSADRRVRRQLAEEYTAQKFQEEMGVNAETSKRPNVQTGSSGGVRV